MNKNYFFNDLFDLIFTENENLIFNPIVPTTYNEDGILKMDLKLPGYAKSDLDINANSKFLTIKTKDDLEETRIKKHFKREFKLDNAIDIEKIQAQMENGILTIVFETSDKKLNIKIK